MYSGLSLVVGRVACGACLLAKPAPSCVGEHRKIGLGIVYFNPDKEKAGMNPPFRPVELCLRFLSAFFMSTLASVLASALTSAFASALAVPLPLSRSRTFGLLRRRPSHQYSSSLRHRGGFVGLDFSFGRGIRRSGRLDFHRRLRRAIVTGGTVGAGVCASVTPANVAPIIKRSILHCDSHKVIDRIGSLPKTLRSIAG